MKNVIDFHTSTYLHHHKSKLQKNLERAQSCFVSRKFNLKSLLAQSSNTRKAIEN